MKQIYHKFHYLMMKVMIYRR